jgi:hypothetical protein
MAILGVKNKLIECFTLITYINENKLQGYLELFNKQILYQKTGFILGYFQKEMKLSDTLFEFCKSKIGKSIRYMTDKQESNVYLCEWKLYAPKNILSFLEQGGNVNV